MQRETQNNNEAKRKYTTFHLYENVSRWKVAVAAILLFTFGWFGWEQLSRHIALGYIPEVDFPDRDGVIIQDTTFTCAPAALTMLFLDQDIHTSQYEIAKLAGTNLTGTTERGMRRVAERFGYSLRVRKMDFTQIFDYSQPLIIKERFRDSVHVTYIRPVSIPNLKAVEILDPTDGYYMVPELGFYEFFGNPGSKKRCLLIEKIPGAGDEN